MEGRRTFRTHRLANSSYLTENKLHLLHEYQSVTAKQIITVRCKNYTKHINTPYWKSADFLHVKAGKYIVSVFIISRCDTRIINRTLSTTTFMYLISRSNLTHSLFIIFFNIPLHVSSHIVLIIFLGDRSVHRQLEDWPLTACALSGHLRRVTYKEPDAVYIQ